MLPLDESGSVGQPLILRRDIIVTVLEIVRGAWIYVCNRTDINTESDEPTIAGALYHEMWNEKQRRGILGPPQIVNEPASRASNQSLKPDGFIDFKLLYGWGNEQDYFGIECKCVSSSSKGKYERLAREYVTKGIKRFVKGIYIPGHDFAAMLGFVIEGNTEDSINRICEQLKKRQTEILLEENWLEEDSFGKHPNLYRTRHSQTSHNSSINLLHLFLSW